MIGQDGRIAGLALGKMLTDKEYEMEAATLRLRLKTAQENAALQHPLHLGMIRTANAVIEEVKAVAEGIIPATERRLSDPKNNVHRNTLYQEESAESQRRISGGKLTLDFIGEPTNLLPMENTVKGGGAKIKPFPGGGAKPR